MSEWIRLDEETPPYHEPVLLGWENSWWMLSGMLIESEYGSVFVDDCSDDIFDLNSRMPTHWRKADDLRLDMSGNLDAGGQVVASSVENPGAVGNPSSSYEPKTFVGGRALNSPFEDV